MVERYRDIQLIEKDSKTWLAIACDVSAGIGDKALDLVKVPPEIAGYYAAAVPIIELLAIGAVPISVADTVGCAMEGTGEAVIQGVLKAMEEAGVHKDCLTGSTEDNMPTRTTSIGITVVSEVSKIMMKSSIPVKGEHVYIVGLPKMGQQFLEEEVLGQMGEVIDIETVKQVRAMDGISHVLPVGSKGIRYELDLLKAMYSLDVEEMSTSIDVMASAGPATCMIVVCDEKASLDMISGLRQPVIKFGKIKGII